MHESSFCSEPFLLVAAPTTLEVVGDRWKSLCDSFVHQHQLSVPETPIDRSKLDSAGKPYLCAGGGGGSASLYARRLDALWESTQSAHVARAANMLRSLSFERHAKPCVQFSSMSSCLNASLGLKSVGSRKHFSWKKKWRCQNGSSTSNDDWTRAQDYWAHGF